MTQRFEGKTVLVTGASSGIGAAAARLFATEGARVVLAARSEDALNRVATESGGSERALVVACDVNDVAKLASLVTDAERRFGSLHILINNAGYNARGAVETVPVDELLRVVDVNLRAPIALCRLALPALRRAGGGAIVNVASLAGKMPLPDEAAYSAAKFGLRAFSFALAEELRGSDISVSVVSPGPVKTPFIFSQPESVPDIVFSQPMSTAEEVARVIADCAQRGQRERSMSPLSGYLTTLGYLLPSASRVLRPWFERLGRRRKKRYAWP